MIELVFDHGGVKRVVQVRLLPTSVQANALEATLRACNAAANWLSEQMFRHKIFNKFGAQRAYYGQIRGLHGLSAQPTLRVIGKVAEIYARKRSVRHVWRPLAAQPFDARCLSWQISDDSGRSTVSIWTTCGRIRGLRIIGNDAQLASLARSPIGESDLYCRDGKWFLAATIESSDVPLQAPTGFLGVDMGIVNIATTSDGVRESGARLNNYRRRQLRLRNRLQQKRTSSARRLLKKRRRKEARFATDVNHKISKRIVVEAQRTGRGIAVEDLHGIRDRVRLRKPQRAMVHSWAFGQLGHFLQYKATRAGVAYIEVDPAYTSQACHLCGNVDKSNRRSQADFKCVRCGFVGHADHNAARNIASRGAARWGEVMRPHAASTLAAS